ncbi:aminodeoxychorismate synthase component I [Novilysobacter antarcticus]|uniref:aminodeoxychorismate synthase component I n=1 Tax=Novilysobacter antarcticus TaxID=2862543 RepID=UPI001C994BD5|nr:aminodeoxychorismate synthase component I [Lysobacter antarcticus]
MTRSLPADTDLLALHRLNPASYPLLLESSAAGTAQGRWDLLLIASGEAFQLDRDGAVRDEAGRTVGSDFLDVLDAAWQQRCVEPVDSPWPFRGGWALLLGYELAGQIERVLDLPAAPGSLPVARAVRCPAAILRDHSTGECIAIAEPGAGPLLKALAADLVRAPQLPALSEWEVPATVVEEAPGRYLDAIVQVLEYLAAGDVFQANISRRWCAGFARPVEPSVLFQRLRQHNPAPFAGLFAGPNDSAEGAGKSDVATWAVVSASPERLVSVRGDLVQSRPIAGTRPRIAGQDDAARIRELVGNPKERAEHIMLIDLERNDLGRVCVAGSVEVDELMTVESYAHVHHIVSNVRGRLRASVTPGEVIRATFPGGTITGCPKVRCMQIIAELEGEGRGSYTGAMGWLNRDGDLDLNILIRSAEVEGTQLRFRTGAGIVADSEPVLELEETRAKARGMLRALGVADGPTMAVDPVDPASGV